MKKRVIAYIDGFNLYHSIDDLDDNRLKWLDLYKLSKKYTYSISEELIEVKYFTAYATHIKSPDHVKRHKTYVAALLQKGVKLIKGKFKWKGVHKCRKCGHEKPLYEEKETDVNIAIEMLEDAFNDNCDKFLLITADSDLGPALKKIKSFFPDKEIGVVTPPGRKGTALRDLACKTYKITEEHLQECLLEQVVTTNEGKTILIPDKYKIK